MGHICIFKVIFESSHVTEYTLVKYTQLWERPWDVLFRGYLDMGMLLNMSEGHPGK